MQRRGGATECVRRDRGAEDVEARQGEARDTNAKLGREEAAVWAGRKG